MTVYTFMDKYLKEDAMITLEDEAGNIMYEGIAGKAPFCIWRKRTVLHVEGLGSLDDLIITMSGKSH